MIKYASSNLNRTRTGQLQNNPKIKKSFVSNITEGLVHKQIEDCLKDNAGESMKRLDKILMRTAGNQELNRTQSFNSQNKEEQTQMDLLT